MSGIRIMTFVLIIMHILPVVITQLLILEYPFDGRKDRRIVKRVNTAANIILKGMVLCGIMMYSRFDLMGAFNSAYSYQNISGLATSNIVFCESG